MSDITQFIAHGAERITPRILKNLLHRLPMLKLEFTQIKDPNYPHLVDQLEFLSDALEDSLEEAYIDLPIVAVAAIAFAIIYAHNVSDLIPDHIHPLGHADDSAVVRGVLTLYEKDLRAYALFIGANWDKISTKP
ncbi:MAG: DUF1232 domain-containing protein [Methylacidiphilales bacterium]|nr:DUF1232 domain-containing protein [Candidatus Methylacidiphilales bacterium]MDW8348762.1 DUF1232 domain-containing protein [Verrucomicrobiae bacterium]